MPRTPAPGNPRGKNLANFIFRLRRAKTAMPRSLGWNFTNNVPHTPPLRRHGNEGRKDGLKVLLERRKDKRLKTVACAAD